MNQWLTFFTILFVTVTIYSIVMEQIKSRRIGRLEELKNERYLEELMHKELIELMHEETVRMFTRDDYVPAPRYSYGYPSSGVEVKHPLNITEEK